MHSSASSFKFFELFYIWSGWSFCFTLLPSTHTYTYTAFYLEHFIDSKFETWEVNLTICPLQIDENATEIIEASDSRFDRLRNCYAIPISYRPLDSFLGKETYKPIRNDALILEKFNCAIHRIPMKLLPRGVTIRPGERGMSEVKSQNSWMQVELLRNTFFPFDITRSIQEYFVLTVINDFVQPMSRTGMMNYKGKCTQGPSSSFRLRRSFIGGG